MFVVKADEGTDSSEAIGRFPSDDDFLRPSALFSFRLCRREKQAVSFKSAENQRSWVHSSFWDQTHFKLKIFEYKSYQFKTIFNLDWLWRNFKLFVSDLHYYQYKLWCTDRLSPLT